jgi:hypothetical protein
MERKGVDLHSQTYKLMYNIHEYFMREAENKGPLISFQKSQDWAAVACGIGNRTIKRTLQERLCAIKKTWIYIISFSKEKYNNV